ncbi:MAG: biotin transporter BioY [Desulfotomaculum sp.]|nr:biotin transporter BioY [Desulfotomaculum sp.]
MRFTTREMTMVATMAAIMAVVAIIFRFYPIVFGTVPFSLLPFIAVLAGGILGARLGAWSMTVYVLMGLVGLPVFATEPYGGIVYVLKPTFGFIIGYIAAAYVSGMIIKRKADAGILTYVLAMLAGMAAIYICGLPYLYLMLNLYLGQAVAFYKILVGMAPFMIFDVLKALVAAAVARSVVKRLAYR